MVNKINIGETEPITKGDTLNIECTLNEDITNWKIRSQLTDDNGSKIKRASSNVTGGTTSQIEVTDASNGVFIIKFEKDTTTNFCDKASLEVEVENTNNPSEKFTVVRSEDTKIKFRDPSIDWEDNS